jgi:hypothetical protein
MRVFTRKTAQKHALNPIMTLLWVILCKPSRNKGQFRGCTHQLIAQFHGICLKKSQPRKRTFARRAAPLERTLVGVNAPSERAFVLILRMLLEIMVLVKAKITIPREPGSES